MSEVLDQSDLRTKCHMLVYDHFKNLDKTLKWFECQNPLLGNVAPNKMMEMGRTEKLLKFIETQICQNSRS